MDYQFDVDHAKRYGLEEAVMLHNFIFWIRHNRANRKNQHDGRTWTYNTLEAFAELFPFWTVKQIRRILDSLIAQGVILKGNHNARAYDRTCWYALADESLLEISPTICPNGQMEKPKRADGSDQTGRPIPDSKQDKKQEREERPANALPLPVGAGSEPTTSLSSLLTRMKTEAQARGAALVVGRDWSAGIGELISGGTSEKEILRAFETCIETAPDRVTFFPRDFLKWRKVSRDQTAKAREHQKEERSRDARECELATERERIIMERESEEGRATVEQALARLPWRRGQSKGAGEKERVGEEHYERQAKRV